MRRLSFQSWLAAMHDPRHRLLVNDRFFGEAVRTDGWSCRGRSTPWHMIYLALEGRSAGRSADGADLSIEPGQALWLPPGAVHDMDWTPTFRYDEIWFRLGDVTPLRRATVFRGAAETRPLFDRLADELAVRRPFREPGLRCALAHLSLELFRVTARPASQPRGLTVHQRERVSRFTQAHLSESLSAADLARVVEMSPDYFTRVFRATFGCSPRTWLTRERARAASRLLADSTLRIYQVAERLGYSDVPQFSRQFKAEMGVSPEAFRRAGLSRSSIDRGGRTTRAI